MKLCKAERSAGCVTAATTTVLIKHEIFSWINLGNRPNEENRNISLFLPGNFPLCHLHDNVSAKKHGMFFREQRSHCPHVDQMNVRSTLAQCRVEIKMHFIGQKEVRSTLPILTPARSIAKWMINRFVLRFDKWVTDDTHRNQNLLQCICS